MVKGLENFKRFFQDYKNEYVLIGGAACDIIFEDAEQSFRATRDLDLVLMEALTPAFGISFWEFIKEGKYHYADGDGELYAGAIKKIKGKYYAFHEEGWMLNGLVLMKVDADGSIDVLDDGVDSDELSDLLDNDKYDSNKKAVPAEYSLYYFGNDEDRKCNY